METGKINILFILLLLTGFSGEIDNPSTENDSVSVDSKQHLNFSEPQTEFTFAEGEVRPSRGLVGWWPGDGNAHDIIGDNDGEMLFDSSYATGLVGEAFSFDGVEDMVLIDDNIL